MRRTASLFVVIGAAAWVASCSRAQLNIDGVSPGAAGGPAGAGVAGRGTAGRGAAGRGTAGREPTSDSGAPAPNVLAPGVVPPPIQAPEQCDPREQFIDKVDLLFVVDNSGSMREEQASLRAQFPRLVRVLTSGDTNLDGREDFPPVADLHLGVVSSDMGLVGIDGIEHCEGLGDDGILRSTPNPALPGCFPSYPSFLTYLEGHSDPERVAHDFACVATLGTEGCGYEQPLEAALKALWPSVDIDPQTGRVVEPNRVLFLNDLNGSGRLGHGDAENRGFLRNDSREGVSLIAVVVVTDEEDCSSAYTDHFTPSQFLDPNDPRAGQPLNLRCYFNPQNLYPIERYVLGLRALRPSNPALVVFAAIAGVPPELVSPEARAAVDFEDPEQREAFYQGVLAHPRMQEVIDPETVREPGAGNLYPSCESPTGKAYPPRRIVQVAREFGENGVIASICNEDFGSAMDAILRRIGERLTRPCPAGLE